MVHAAGASFSRSANRTQRVLPRIPHPSRRLFLQPNLAIPLNKAVLDTNTQVRKTASTAPHALPHFDFQSESSTLVASYLVITLNKTVLFVAGIEVPNITATEPRPTATRSPRSIPRVRNREMASTVTIDKPGRTSTNPLETS